MHPIRRLFQKSLKLPKAPIAYSSTHEDANYQWSAGETLVIPDYPNGRLPTELLILIGTYVERKRDLAILCIASKTFRLIYAPFLFRVLEIKGSSESNSMLMQLAAELPTSTLSQLVTELSVHVQMDQTCAKRRDGGKSRMKPESLPRELRGCECGKTAEALAQLLASLHNIKILEIQCDLCTESHNHDHIHHLEMPRLTSFTFHCQSEEAPSQPLESILLAPYMKHVEVLNVTCSRERWYGSLPADVTRLWEAVSNLHTLFHRDEWPYGRLLATQRVERLHVEEYQGYQCGTARGKASRRLHEDICRSPGVLSHLSMSDILGWLPFAMEHKMEPYQHLGFIGTIDLENGETAALAALRVLVPLKALKSIAIHQALTSSSRRILVEFNPNLEFFVLLGQDLPSLRRVFLHPREPTLWENQGTWERRSIPQFEPWDLVSGKIDAF